MIRLRPHRVGKAESLFVANLKPFFDSIDPIQTLPLPRPVRALTNPIWRFEPRLTEMSCRSKSVESRPDG
jgi:hypothetical protein